MYNHTQLVYKDIVNVFQVCWVHVYASKTVEVEKYIKRAMRFEMKLDKVFLYPNSPSKGEIIGKMKKGWFKCLWNLQGLCSLLLPLSLSLEEM